MNNRSLAVVRLRRTVQKIYSNNNTHGEYWAISWVYEQNIVYDIGEKVCKGIQTLRIEINNIPQVSSLRLVMVCERINFLQSFMNLAILGTSAQVMSNTGMTELAQVMFFCPSPSKEKINYSLSIRYE